MGILIPEWNDLVRSDRWHDAIERLHATNNFPEFTGRLCPAPCEGSCVLGINQDPVTIKQIEVEIIDKAFDEGWVVPLPPDVRTGKKVAVVGSGPAGLAAAQQLTRAGHSVTVFERDDRIGGLLRYGIPEFKMEKRHIDRRLAQMEAEGTEFRPGVNVGMDITAHHLRTEFDAIVLAGGATAWRDLPIPGRELDGIHQAMEFLPWANRVQQGDPVTDDDGLPPLHAKGKKVIIIGGGDTGADCLGTVHRQGPASVHQFEIMPRPPETRADSTPWPVYPLMFRVASAHEEGGERVYSVNTERFVGEDGQVKALRAHEVRMEGGKSSSRSTTATSTWKPTWCCWRWASSDRSARVCDRSERRVHRPWQRHPRRLVRHIGARRLRRRRHGPRPVADRVGHRAKAARQRPVSTAI